MNKEDYFKELEASLSKLSFSERCDAINYYREFSEDAGLETYEDLVKEFGTPKTLSATIYSATACEVIKEDKHTSRALGISILALLSLPLSLPLAITVLAVSFGLVVSLFAIIVSLIVTVGAVGIGSIYLIISSFFLIDNSIFLFIKTLGAGLVTLVISVVMGFVIYILIKYLMKGLTILISKYIKKVNKQC